MSRILRNQSKRFKIWVIFISILAFFGFLLDIFVYDSNSLTEIGLSFVRLPKTWNKLVNQQENSEQMFLPGATVAEWDKPDLLNLPFKWLLNNESLCQINNSRQDDEIYLLPILIHTARSHFTERLAIRRTWGSSSNYPIYKKWLIRPVFLLGEGNMTKPGMDKENRELREEHEKYGDLVLGSFIDSYRNLTYKHLMGYKWILNFCQNAKFILKIDDDSFINIFKWIDWRIDDLEKAAGNDNPHLYCFTYVGAKPRRNPKDKWFISKETYSPAYYPDYCMGCAYGMTLEYIQQIYYISNFANFKNKNAIDTRGVMFVERGKSLERYMMCLWNASVAENLGSLSDTLGTT